MGPSSQVAESVPPLGSAPRSGRTGMIVIGLCLLGSATIAVIAWEGFKRSEQLLLDDLQTMRARGRDLSVEGCVGATIDWWKSCGAMSELCDRSVGRVMEQCLDARDRTDYCARTDTASNERSGFGYADCEARASGDRKLKKHCGTAYRAVAYYCQQIKGLASKETP